MRFRFLKVFRIEKAGELYLWRLRVLETPWFGIKLHWIRMPDMDRDPHDHPWSFVSFILWGWYKQRWLCKGAADSRRYGPSRFQNDTCWHESLVRWINVMEFRSHHQVTEVSRGGAWTLVFNGPYRGKWGFLTTDGWVRYEDYLGLPRNDKETE